MPSFANNVGSGRARCGTSPAAALIALLGSALLACSPEAMSPDANVWESYAVVPGATFGSPYLVTASQDGRLLVAGLAFDDSAPHRVVELDSTFSVLRVIGGIGEGPGEYRRPRNLGFKGDTLIVASELQRTLMFDPAGVSIGQLPHPGPVNGMFHFFRGDTMIVAAPLPTREGFGLPFHAYGSDGAHLLSFGAEDRSFTSEQVMKQFRWIAVASDSTFWAAPLHEYSLQLWSSTGHLLREFQPKSQWFRASEGSQGSADTQRPGTSIQRIHQASDGTLLVLINRARPDWQPRSVVAPDTPEGMYSLGESSLYIEQVIDRIDARTGDVLSTTALTVPDTHFLGFLADGRLYGATRGPDGDALVVARSKVSQD